MQQPFDRAFPVACFRPHLHKFPGEGQRLLRHAAGAADSLRAGRACAGECWSGAGAASRVRRPVPHAASSGRGIRRCFRCGRSGLGLTGFRGRSVRRCKALWLARKAVDIRLRAASPISLASSSYWRARRRRLFFGFCWAAISCLMRSMRSPPFCAIACRRLSRSSAGGSAARPAAVIRAASRSSSASMFDSRFTSRSAFWPANQGRSASRQARSCPPRRREPAWASQSAISGVSRSDLVLGFQHRVMRAV